MNSKAREALKQSIKKWEEIVSGEGEDEGVNSFDLCRLYYTAIDADISCRACPVYEYTGEKYCKKTPYADWREHHASVHGVEGCDRIEVKCNVCRAIATKEAEFLKSLLKEENDGK